MADLHPRLELFYSATWAGVPTLAPAQPASTVSVNTRGTVHLVACRTCPPVLTLTRHKLAVAPRARAVDTGVKVTGLGQLTKLASPAYAARAPKLARTKLCTGSLMETRAVGARGGVYLTQLSRVPVGSLGLTFLQDYNKQCNDIISRLKSKNGEIR